MKGKFKEYADDLKVRDIAPGTRHLNRRCVQDYEIWLDGNDPTEETLRSYLAYLRDVKGHAATSIKVMYWVLKQFHRFIGQDFKIRVKAPHVIPPFIHVEEVVAVLAQIHTYSCPDSFTQLKHRTIITTFALTGIRLGELVGLKRKDIDLATGYLRVFGKGQKMRTVPIGAELAEMLSEYLVEAHVKPNESAFNVSLSTAQRIVRKYSDLAGLPHIHAHSLRHFYASQLVHRGESIKIVQELLGHADITATAIYLQVAPEQLKSAAEKVTLKEGER